MSIEDHFKLDRLFELQDDVLKENLEKSVVLREVYEFLSSSLWLNARTLTSCRFLDEKQTAIRRLACDSLSHAIVGARVGLWGDLPESLTMLRSAIESAAQLLFVVERQNYRTFNHETTSKLSQVRFNEAVAALGDFGKRISQFHGRLSESAAHATAVRMRHVDYKCEGEYYDRVGFARDVQNAELALLHFMDVSLMISRALHAAFEQESFAFPLDAEFAALNQRFEGLRAKVNAKLTAQGASA